MPRWIARGTSGRHRTNSSCRTGQPGTPQTAWAIACHRCTSGEGEGRYAMTSSAECLSHSVEYARWARETGQKEAQCAVRTMAKLLRGKMQPEMDSVGKGKTGPGTEKK